MASEIFNILPGLRMPVNEVTATLSNMWQGQATESGQGKSIFRASQMDLVIHMGLETSAEEAMDRFNTAVKFSQKYPCRIIILCPTKKAEGNTLLEGKLFSRCYLGEDLRDLCCCEALSLSYPIDEAYFLEDQVSLWLEGDLPTYYWINRVDPEPFRNYYISFTKSCRKVIYDSAIESSEYKGMNWPSPESVNDLVLCRLLPVRQSMGQFLSAYPPEVLVDGLKEVLVKCCPTHRADAEWLVRWQKDCLINCAPRMKNKIEKLFRMEDCKDEKHCLEIEWKYEGSDKYFKWWYNEEELAGMISARFDKGETSFPQRLKKISPEEALAEAIFY